eukprot:13724712-Ditylum_brightwellii.AAC.1
MRKTLKGKPLQKRKPFDCRRNNRQGKHVNHVQENKDSKEDVTEEENEDDVEVSDKEEVTHINKEHYDYDSDHDDFWQEAYASVLRIEEAYEKGAGIETDTNKEQVCVITSN